MGNKYHVQTHGVGMTGEYPYIFHPQDWESHGYEGEIVEGMTLCVESYIGAEGGSEGVKMEEHVLITADGCEILSNSVPLEVSFLDDEEDGYICQDTAAEASE